MYQDYDRAAGKVIEYLTENNYAFSVVYMNKRCFHLFKKSIWQRKKLHIHRK